MWYLVRQLNWPYIALAMTAPPLIGGLLAFPFWRMGQPIFGNIVGSIVIFGAAIALIMREHVELDAIVQRCLAQGATCWPEPSAFTRFAIYAFIGLFEVIVLFTLSIRVDMKFRRRLYAPEWK
jgi:hypothetical protein